MKKITYAEAAYIQGYKKNHFIFKYFCDWEIDMECQNAGYIRCSLKPMLAIPAMIIGAIIMFFYVLWDGGLKEFCLPSVVLVNQYISGLTNEGEETDFGRLRIVYDR